jgi:hypothetical protein
MQIKGVEETPDPHLLADVGIVKLEVGKVLTNRVVPAEFPFLDQHG